MVIMFLSFPVLCLVTGQSRKQNFNQKHLSPVFTLLTPSTQHRLLQPTKSFDLNAKRREETKTKSEGMDEEPHRGEDVIEFSWG